MSDLYSEFYKALIVISFIAFIISFMTSGNMFITSLTAGYFILLIAVIMILIMLFNNIYKISQNASTMNVLYSIFMTTGPFLLMVAIISFILYITLLYKKPIVNGEISKNFYTLSNISVALFLLQIFVVYKNINTSKFESTGLLSNVTSKGVYLLGLLTAVCSFNIYNILKYFRTDG